MLEMTDKQFNNMIRTMCETEEGIDHLVMGMSGQREGHIQQLIEALGSVENIPLALKNHLDIDFSKLFHLN